ncbi:MAG: SH3 domain-containing protein [Thermomicrobiales bacterium]
MNLRSSASTGGSVLGRSCPDGATVTLLGQSSNGFAKVRYNGIEGWAYALYLD